MSSQMTQAAHSHPENSSVKNASSPCESPSHTSPTLAALLLGVLSSSCLGPSHETRQAEIERLRAEYALEMKQWIAARESTFDELVDQKVKQRIEDVLPILVEQAFSLTSDGINSAVQKAETSLEFRVTQSIFSSFRHNEFSRLTLPSAVNLNSATEREYLKIHQMRRTTVQITDGNTAGSGTLVYSGPFQNYACATLILTANHVHRDCAANSINGEIPVFIYHENGKEEFKATLVAKDPLNDLALLMINSERPAPDPVAYFLPPTFLARLEPGAPVYAYGCPLGNDPVHSSGAISSTTQIEQIKQANSTMVPVPFYMITAPTYFGNSGGGIWHFVEVGPQALPVGFLLGPLSKIYTHGARNPNPITHMGLVPDPLTTNLFLSNAGFVINPTTFKLECPNIPLPIVAENSER